MLVLLLHYHQLFKLHDLSYDYKEQLWIVKPIASSRGAGISIVRNSASFCCWEGNRWHEFKNRKKFENKIMQRYLPNPYLLPGNGLFSGRKFDIRQWVLIISHNQQPAVFRYHTAYCRFSAQKFTLRKLSREIHLTNYSLFKEENDEEALPSVMMLEDLFSCAR